MWIQNQESQVKQICGVMRKWRLFLNWKILILIVFSLLILGCNKTPQMKPKFHGDYPTENLRGMWQFCFQNFRMKAPYTPLPLMSQMCDCYVDEMRMAHSQKHINNLSDNETREMGLNLIRVCNVHQSHIQKI